MFSNGVNSTMSDPATLSVTSTPDVSGVVVTATDGAFPDHIDVTWTAALNATEYQVWRATKQNLNGAALVRDWSSALHFSDSNVGSMQAGGFRCPGQAAAMKYYYYVVARNPCFESVPSSADSGYASSAKGLGTSQAGLLAPGSGLGEFLLFLAACLAGVRAKRRKPAESAAN